VQSLIALGHKAQMAQRYLTRDPKQLELRIVEFREMIAQSIEEVRRFSHALHPHYLEELGLVAALKALTRDAEAEFLVRGTLSRSTPERELAVYRIIQEALNNAVRHAKSSSIRVELHMQGSQLKLQVCDDGVGFVVPTNFTDLTRAGHFGLIGMRERALLCNGALQIVSTPNQGTSVTLELS
jgi:signal transduction histidine kinase